MEYKTEARTSSRNEKVSYWKPSLKKSIKHTILIFILTLSSFLHHPRKMQVSSLNLNHQVIEMNSYKRFVERLTSRVDLPGITKQFQSLLVFFPKVKILLSSSFVHLMVFASPSVKMFSLQSMMIFSFLSGSDSFNKISALMAALSCLRKIMSF